MLISFPKGIQVDTDNIPSDFEEKILAAFKDYTEGTHPAYMYQDKLGFIDLCVKHLHRAHDGNAAVKSLIMDSVEWELDENGDLPDKDDFWSIGFMEECYEKGRRDASLYGHYTGKHRVDDVIMSLLERAIKAVINYGGDNNA